LLMNVSPAPQSRRALTSTVLVSPVQPLESDTGIYIALLSTSATSTEEIQRQGEIDVRAILPVKKTGVQGIRVQLLRT
jgi:hypothetical protein